MRPSNIAEPTVMPHAPLAITMGEPDGIGIEVALKAWLARHDEDLQPFYLIGDLAELQRQTSNLSLDVPLSAITSPAAARQHFPNALPVFECAAETSAATVIQSIETAVAHALDGMSCGLVTLPINKQKLYSAGFAHPGHTEFLGALCDTDEAPLMMLAIPGLRTVLSTIHIPLNEVHTALTALGSRGVVALAERVIGSLITDFGIERPRLAVAGLNPHGGEQGTIGREEIETIAPAVAHLEHEGFDVSGPYPADTLFHDEARTKYDAVLCHYHDQALIPLKTLNFHEGVNITLGLPIVRTSPDHGTAEDIAGRGIADPRSLICAIRMAAQIADHRTTERQPL